MYWHDFIFLEYGYVYINVHIHLYAHVCVCVCVMHMYTENVCKVWKAAYLPVIVVISRLWGLALVPFYLHSFVLSKLLCL